MVVDERHQGARPGREHPMHYHSTIAPEDDVTAALGQPCDSDQVTCHDTLEEAIAYVGEPLGDERAELAPGTVAIVQPAA
jgi:hypothetical protein